MNAESSVRARRSCSPYPPAELERFKALLLERQTELVRSCQGLSQVALKQSGGRGTDDSQVTDDTADLAAEILEQDVSLNMLGRVQAEIEEISLALERIEERSYGVCDQCASPIPVARLEAIPTADTCIDCKSASENL